MSPGDDYTFVCPACGESMSVNAAMREALVANGCVICGSPVSPDDFTAVEDVEA
jgi:transcription elongation factor Elf1